MGQDPALRGVACPWSTLEAPAGASSGSYCASIIWIPCSRLGPYNRGLPRRRAFGPSWGALFMVAPPGPIRGHIRTPAKAHTRQRRSRSVRYKPKARRRKNISQTWQSQGALRKRYENRRNDDKNLVKRPKKKIQKDADKKKNIIENISQNKNTAYRLSVYFRNAIARK